mmetsp:Transcript_43508/g.94733  ORF Transcript_43508/g.94733 Transcript_43508/m.94733 type:complete len:246 (-) Transcript_43508:46-783(-)
MRRLPPPIVSKSASAASKLLSSPSALPPSMPGSTKSSTSRFFKAFTSINFENEPSRSVSMRSKILRRSLAPGNCSPDLALLSRRCRAKSDRRRRCLLRAMVSKAACAASKLSSSRRRDLGSTPGRRRRATSGSRDKACMNSNFEMKPSDPPPSLAKRSRASASASSPPFLEREDARELDAEPGPEEPVEGRPRVSGVEPAPFKAAGGVPGGTTATAGTAPSSNTHIVPTPGFRSKAQPRPSANLK